MPEFPVNPHRFDPYKCFKFRVKWDGKYVAGVSRISGLRRTTDVVEQRDGGDPNFTRKSPGVTRYQPLVLERGVTHDTEFEQWASKVLRHGAGFGNEVRDEELPQGQHRRALQRGRPARPGLQGLPLLGLGIQALPDLDANGSTVAIESIKLETRAGSATSRSRSRSNPPSYSVVTTSV